MEYINFERILSNDFTKYYTFSDRLIYYITTWLMSVKV